MIDRVGSNEVRKLLVYVDWFSPRCLNKNLSFPVSYALHNITLELLITMFEDLVGEGLGFAITMIGLFRCAYL